MRTLILNGGDAAAMLESLARSGRPLHPGWSPPRHGFAVTDTRVVCHGTVSSLAGVGAAVLAAARGAGVIAAVGAAPGLAERLYEDLSRFGPVQVVDAPEPNTPALDHVTLALLDAVSAGRRIADAAGELGISSRTAHRRLATARQALGAATTAQLLARR